MSLSEQSIANHPGVTPAQFDLIFPFHLVLDRDLSVRHRACSIARVCPDVLVGAPFKTHFELIRPQLDCTFNGLRAMANCVTLWKHRASGLKFRGQFLSAADNESLLLIWSPWLADNEELSRHGLMIEDFAPHDPVVDMLQMLQAQKIAFRDVRQLADKLKSQHAQLVETNAALTLQYSLLDLVKEDLKRQEEESRKLAMIAARTDNAVVLTDARGCVEWINEGFTRVTGYALEEVAGKTPGAMLQGPKTDPWAIAYMHEQLRQGLGFKVEVVNYTKSGQEYWVHIEVQPIVNEQGEITNFMAIERDTTEARNIRLSLEKASRQAMAANAAKSEFLANMSHEIRTPMNAVLGLAQMLERETLSASQRDMVQRIRTAGQSLLAIINDILDFSKIEAGQLRVEQRPFRLQVVLARLESLMGEAARGKGLELHTEPLSWLNGQLVGDGLRLEQVLLNLVSNAVKFTEQGQISIGVIPITLSKTHTRLRFEVRDTGMGIPPEALARLFTPFTQADSGITRRFGGTGLGLSISKQLIELMGGAIGVTSTPGAGSTFWFEIPFERTAAQAEAELSEIPAPSSGGGPRLNGVRCLVVDDSRMNLDVVERALTYEGATVIVAADGQQALHTLRAKPQGFDIVLMDQQMPVMDGLTATRAIRQELGLTTLPVITFTAGVLAEQRDAARSAGASDFLSKPVDLDEMVAMLLRWTSPATPNPPEARDPIDPEAGPGLPSIAGIDTVQAARTLGNDREFFLELLGRFVNDYADVVSETREKLTRGERESAADRLHTLRGNAGNLGAREIIASAQALEIALLSSATEPNAELTAFASAFESLVKASAPWRQGG